MRLVGFVLGDHEPISFVDTAGDTVYAQVVKPASRELGQRAPRSMVWTPRRSREGMTGFAIAGGGEVCCNP